MSASVTADGAYDGDPINKPPRTVSTMPAPDVVTRRVRPRCPSPMISISRPDAMPSSARRRERPYRHWRSARFATSPATRSRGGPGWIGLLFTNGGRPRPRWCFAIFRERLVSEPETRQPGGTRGCYRAEPPAGGERPWFASSQGLSWRNRFGSIARPAANTAKNRCVP